MKGCVFILFFFLMTPALFGQDKDKLFGTEKTVKTRSGFILNGNGDFDLPGADMAKRFGASFRAGPGLLYKTKSNWIFGLKFDFILGNIVKQDSLMINITDKYSTQGGKIYEFIDQSGERIGVPVYERGYATGVVVGKIIPINKKTPDNGITLLTTGGFIQHKIDIYDKDKSVLQLRGDYLKGYDRLTNGLFAEQYAGYTYFSNSHLINFTLGFDALFGFTQGRRTWLYDVNRPDTGNRLDILFGIRGGWLIPIFKKKSEEMFF
jgi:hypothetical protein